MNSEHKRAIADAMEEGLKEVGHIIQPRERKLIEMTIEMTIKTLEKIEEIKANKQEG
ncbi:hypothetical protein [Niallia sp. RD1]|uniref:hypothetical protein n=1 Tax=Niallia sp. RD1 TaxID=2962858 RepID=UPI0020C1B6C2|nr:hypothetical protein [Niallia sp. RD1]UTI41109.1 hypothetical protein NKG37_19940 [Niallia sp. RD1]